MTEGHKVVEKLGKVPGCNALIDDVEGQTLETKRRMDQMHAYWLKVESTMSNTLQLRKYKEEACSLLIEMNDMVGKLGRVDFGSSCDDFEVKEQKFGATAEQCSVSMTGGRGGEGRVIFVQLVYCEQYCHAELVW